MKAKARMSSNELDMAVMEMEMLWNGCGVYVDTEKFSIIRGCILINTFYNYSRILARVEKMKNLRFLDWFLDNSDIFFSA